VRKREAEDGITVDPPNVVVVAGNLGVPILHWCFSVVGLMWRLGVHCVRTTVPWLGPERSREGLGRLV
jgi:hypothetical protein